MRVVVDFDVCEANALCQDSAPEVFEVDEDDRLHVRVERPDASLREKVERAVRRCPKRALSLVDD